jgi:hypothetical protein
MRPRASRRTTGRWWPTTPTSRSILRNGQAFPSVSTYIGPEAIPDGSIDWIQTVPGTGYVLLFRLYGPLEPFVDKSWRPGDLEPLGAQSSRS